MKINHNIQALNAYRNLYQNQFNTSKNLERLSSGLRINRAADDAAGLAISEKMRSQIKGLSMAERNSLDGVSLMQVAEGAMNEVHSMLQRMRELSVQAANDTNTTSDREAIQLEIDQLTKEIDSIAAKTEFNTRKLLDGSSAVDTQYIVGENAKTNIKQVPTVVDPTIATGTYEIGVDSPPTLTYTLNQPGAGVSTSSVLKISTVGEYRNGEVTNTNLGTVPVINDPALSLEDASYKVIVANKNFTSLPTLVGTSSTGIAAANITINSTTKAVGGDYTIKVSNYTTGSPNTADVQILDAKGNEIDSVTGMDLSNSDMYPLGSTDPEFVIADGSITSNGTTKFHVASQADITIQKYDNANNTWNNFEVATNVDLQNGQINIYGNFEFNFDPATLKNGSTIFDTKTSDLSLGEYSVVVSDYQVDSNGANSATIEIFDPSGFSLGKLASEIGGNGSVKTIGTEAGKSILVDTSKITQAGTAKVQIESEMKISVSKLSEDGTTKTPITFPKELTTKNGVITHGGLELLFGANAKQGESKFDLTNKALSFQIGANTNQNVQIDIPQLSTVKLGVDSLDVSTNESASMAVFNIDKAINQISSTRAKLGATQNRLEHTISNLQVTSENLTSAESRIRDTDMAQEMTEFTKNNILNQSAQAMLAQANQLPNGVLKLLQG